MNRKTYNTTTLNIRFLEKIQMPKREYIIAILGDRFPIENLYELPNTPFIEELKDFFYRVEFNMFGYPIEIREPLTNDGDEIIKHLTYNEDNTILSYSVFCANERDGMYTSGAVTKCAGVLFRNESLYKTQKYINKG